MTSTASPNKLLKALGLYMSDGFLSREECLELTTVMRSAKGVPASVYTSDNAFAVRPGTRRARSVDVTAAIERRMRERFDRIRGALSRHFGLVLEACETPQYLVYEEGAFFRVHRDRRRESATPLEDSSREVSVVVLLSRPDPAHGGDYDGGELRFFDLIEAAEWRGLGIVCEAEPGRLIAFRADTLHEVATITRGCRCAIATWFSRSPTRATAAPSREIG